MDLGIGGRTALVCASSRGLGLACAAALAEAGVAIVLNGRSSTTLAVAAEGLRRRFPAGDMRTVEGDVGTEAGRAAVLATCPAPDILITNAGGPPVGDWRNFSAEDWHRAVDANMLSAVFLTRAVLPAMIERGFGRIVNITSAMVKSPHELLALSTAARLALTGFVRSLAPTVVQQGVTINNLLPEQFDTDRLRSNIASLAARNGVPYEDELKRQIAASPARRFGKPEEFGATCAFLCSSHAGYMTAQNILLDAGRYPGIF